MTREESNARRICCPMCDRKKCDREADDCDVKIYLKNKAESEGFVMDDLISRQAAIEATWFEPSYTDPLNVLTEVRDRLKALPSAQPEQRWIPCSERLPEDDDEVIITTGFEIYVGWFDTDDHTWRLRNDYITSIVAWMPLPEPYKAESEEK